MPKDSALPSRNGAASPGKEPRTARGRETLRPRIPDNLTIYESADKTGAAEEGFIESKPSLRTRLEHWISGHQHH